MSDISALGIKITSSGVVKTTSELTAFSKAAKAARQSAQSDIKIKVGDTGVAKALADLQKLQKAMGSRGGGVSVSITTRGSAAAIRDINAFAKAVTDAKSKVGSGITVQLKANGSAAAARNLNEFTAAAKEARASAKAPINLNVGVAGGGSSGRGSSGFRQIKKDLDDVNKSFKFTATEGLNFSRQMADIGVTAAMGMNPLMIAIQQGPQLFDIFQQASVRSGKSTAEVFKVAAGQAMKFIPALAGVATVAGVAAAGLWAWNDSVGDKNKKALEAYAKSLNLTKEEIKAAGGASITLADQFGGLWDAFKEIIGFDKIMKELGDSVKSTFSDILDNVKQNLSELYAAIYAIDDILKYVGEHGGKMFAEGLINGLNAAIAAINDFGTIYGPDGKAFWTPNIPQIENKYAGAGEKAVGAFKDAFGKNFEDRKNQFGESMDKFISRGEKFAMDRAMKRLKGQASDRKNASDKLAERLAREAAATEEVIAGNYAVYEAYKVSNAEAIRAGIVAKATSEAIKKQADVQSYVARQLRLAVSERIKDSGAMINGLDREYVAQKSINDALASGALSYEKAAESLEKLNKMRELQDTLELAEFSGDPKAIKAATDALNAYVLAQDNVNKERKRFIDLSAAYEASFNLKDIQEQTKLEKELGEARLSALKGLSGDALEDELERINNERERGSIIIEYDLKITRALANEQWEYVKALRAEKEARLGQLQQSQDFAGQERKLEQDRRRALDLAHEIADIVGGSIGSAVSALADALDNFDKVFGGNGASGIGKFLKETKVFGKELGEVLKGMGAGARLGGAVDSVFDAIGVKSSKTGAQVGGALGSLIPGPLGAIAGSILGGIVGGMLKSTPRASATISVVAGQAMETAIKGSSDKLKKIAGGMADSVLSGLTDLADALGAELTGNANVSIGQRNGKYRVDTTGQGITKTSKGAVDFGEDQAAAIAFALQDAIKDGVLSGLGDSLNRLIQGDGDLQRQLQKALNFKSVFDELAQRLDPQQYDLDQLDKWRAGMDKIFAEAGATAEELAKLEQLTGLKRTEIVEKYAEQLTNNEELIQQRRQMEIELLEAQGKSVEALAASRKLELEAMDASLRPLQEQIWATLDAADAAAKLADAEAAIATTRRSIELQILDLVDSEQALAERRADELAATDESLRPLLLRLYALQDEQSATQAATQALEALAEAQRAAASEVDDLYKQWLELTGQTQQLRQLTLDALLSDEARDLQQKIWAYTDAQEAAAIAAENAAKAEEARMAAIADAQNVLSQAYERESSAIQSAMDKFQGFADSIKEFGDSLYGADNPTTTFAKLQADFRQTSRRAGMGNEDALGRFVGDAQAYLDSARDNAGSSLEYRRAVAEVAQATQSAQGGAMSAVSAGDRQLKAFQELAGFYPPITENLISVKEAVENLNALTASSAPILNDTVATGIATMVESLNTQTAQYEKADSDRRVENTAIFDILYDMYRIVKSNDRGGAWGVTSDAAQPVVVKVDGNVTVDVNGTIPVDVTGQPIQVEDVTP